MSFVLNNVATGNEYTTAATLEGGPGNRALIDVYNESIFYQLLTSFEGMVGRARWQPEKFLAPGSRQVTRKGIFGIRARSAVEGKPGRVTLEIVGENE